MAASLVLAEEFHRRFSSRTALYRDEQIDTASARAGASVGLRGQKLAGNGISVLALVAVTAVVLLSGAITAFTLFGAPLLGG